MDHEVVEEAHEDSAPLLGGPRKVPDDDERDGQATLTSGIGNLLNTIVGTGMLSFPLVCFPPFLISDMNLL